TGVQTCARPIWGDDMKTTGVPEQVAGNGLLHRRLFLTGGVAVAGAAGLQLLTARTASAAEPPDVPEWMKVPGAGMSGYGQRSRYEADVQRQINSQPGTTGSGGSRTPLEHLEGIITPSG